MIESPDRRDPAGSRGVDVAVVGGGIVGCVVALRLASAGHAVTLFESAAEIGGLASPWTLGPLEWDRHYHVICESDANLRSLLRELGLEQEIAWTSVRTGFFSNGALHEFTSVRDFLAFPPLRLYEKLRLGAAIVYASRVDPQRLRTITASRWLARLCGKRVHDEIWEPLLRAKLGANASRVAASFIAVTIKRLFGARTNTSGAERFGFVPGGYARILRVLRERLTAAGVTIRCSTPVSSIVADGGSVMVTTDDGTRRFDHAVVTAPSPLLGRLLPQLPAPNRAQLASVPYAGVICASALLERPLSPYYITNITDRWVPFSAIIEFSNVTGTAAFDGKSLVYLPKYVAPDDPLFDADDATIRASFTSAIGRMIPSFDPAHITAFAISRVRNVFPFPVASTPYTIPPFDSGVAGVTIATAAQIDDATLNVDRSIGLAHSAAEHVAATITR